MRRCRTCGLQLNSQVPARKHGFLIILFYFQESFLHSCRNSGHVAHRASSVSGHFNEAWSSAARQAFREDPLCRKDAVGMLMNGCHWSCWRYWYHLISRIHTNPDTSRAAHCTGKVWSPFQTPLRGRAAKCAESSSLLGRGAREIWVTAFPGRQQNQRRPEVWYQLLKADFSWQFLTCLYFLKGNR